MPELIVRIVGDASSLEKSYKQAQRQTSGFAKEIERAGRGATVATIGFRGLGRSVAFASGAFLGGAGFVAGVKASVEAASNLNEQFSKTNVVFGGSADAVEQWSKATVTSMGLAQDQALAVASTFGALFQPLGIVGDQAAQQSERLTQLGADLASFYNTDVQDALDAIRSGLVGQSEPLRRYGVLLSETRVQQEALTETGKTSVKQLTDQDKVLARIALTFKDSAQAQGDFSRTSQGFANQTRILKANLRELEIEIGQRLIPALTRLVSGLNDVLGALHKFGNLPGGNQGLIQILKPVDQFGGKYSTDAVLHRIGVELGFVGDKAKQTGDIFTTLRLTVEAAAGQMQKAVEQTLAAINKPTSSLAARTIGTDRAQGQKGGPLLYPGVPVEQRNTIFDQRIGRDITRAGYIQSLSGQIARFRQIIGLIQQRINATKDITRRLNLEDQLLAVQDMIRGVQAQQQANADEAARKADEAAKKRAEAAKKRAEALKKLALANVKLATERVAAVNKGAVAQVQRLQQIGNRIVARRRAHEAAVQFGILGLDPTGEARTPTQKELQRRNEQLRERIQGTALDTAANRGIFARLAHQYATAVDKMSKPVRDAIDRFYDDIAQKLGEGGDRLTGPSEVGGRKLVGALTHGLGLTPRQLGRISSRVGGMDLTTTSPIVIQNNIHLDGALVARSVTKHQQRDRYRTARQTTGFRG